MLGGFFCLDKKFFFKFFFLSFFCRIRTFSSGPTIRRPGVVRLSVVCLLSVVTFLKCLFSANFSPIVMKLGRKVPYNDLQ